MVFRPVTHGIEVALHYRMDAQEIVNTVGFYATNASPTLAQVTAANALVTGAFLTDLLLLMTDQITFYKSVSTALDTDQGAQFILEAEASGSISASDPMPMNIAALIAAKSARRGKGETAHFYMCGLVEGEVVGNEITTSLQDELTTTFGLLPLSPTGDGIQWGLLSRKNGVAYPIKSYVVHGPIATQKLRLPGRRRRRAVTP